MTTAMIFILGVFVTLIVVVATLMVGLGEAADSSHSRASDLSEWELALVKEERARRRAAAEGEARSVDS